MPGAHYNTSLALHQEGTGAWVAARHKASLTFHQEHTGSIVDACPKGRLTLHQDHMGRLHTIGTTFLPLLEPVFHLRLCFILVSNTPTLPLLSALSLKLVEGQSVGKSCTCWLLIWGLFWLCHCFHPGPFSMLLFRSYHIQGMALQLGPYGHGLYLVLCFSSFSLAPSSVLLPPQGQVLQLHLHTAPFFLPFTTLSLTFRCFLAVDGSLS